MRINGPACPALFLALQLAALPPRFASSLAFSNRYLDSLSANPGAPFESGVLPQQAFQNLGERQHQPVEEKTLMLSDASRYLDSDGASYVESLAEGQRRTQQQQQSSPRSSDKIAQLESRVASLEAELSNLKAENRAVRSAAEDLLRRIYALADHLDEMEGHRLELANVADRWEDTMRKSAESFPDERELESYEWLLSR